MEAQALQAGHLHDYFVASGLRFGCYSPAHTGSDFSGGIDELVYSI
jgi:hypothetical protein